MNADQLFGKIVEKLQSWLEALIVMLPNAAVALLVLVVFWFLSKGARKGTYRLATRMHATARMLAARLAQFAVLVIGLTLALSVLQLEGAVASLLAGAGIIGLALGFAFQDMAANFMSGVGMSIRRPMNVGDIIETNEVMGVVEQIELRSTVLRTFAGQTVLIPNKHIYQEKVTIYSDRGTRRVDLPVGISYGDDLEKVKRVTIEAVEAVTNRDETRDVELFFEAFGDSSINFEVRFWIPFHKQTDYLEARSQAVMRIKKAFDENDITIPFPIRTLDFGIKGGETLAEMYPQGLATTARKSA